VSYYRLVGVLSVFLLSSLVNQPIQGLAVDENETIYVIPFAGARLERWLANATQGTVIVGGNEWGSRPNQLRNAQGVMVDRLGTLYVADTVNHRILRVPSTGGSTTNIAGGNGDGNAPNQLYYPRHLAMDNEANLYVLGADNRVKMFAYDKSSCLSSSEFILLTRDIYDFVCIYLVLG
jgi:sugar lactone lactonase YvrE